MQVASFCESFPRATRFHKQSAEMPRKMTKVYQVSPHSSPPAQNPVSNRKPTCPKPKTQSPSPKPHTNPKSPKPQHLNPQNLKLLTEMLQRPGAAAWRRILWRWGIGAIGAWDDVQEVKLQEIGAERTWRLYGVLKPIFSNRHMKV